MGSNQFHPAFSGRSSDLSPQRSSSSPALSNPSISRSNAVRYRTAPLPTPGTRREYLMLREKLLDMIQSQRIVAYVVSVSRP
ncbi:MAG: hypothetical protein STHCBS139747_007107 [Sporothrix thermara]